MSESRIALGKRGEELAAAHLLRQGYRILERNCRLTGGEVDIVAEEGGTVVFVEVKTRMGLGFGHPLESVTRRKQRQLIKVALEYIGRRKLHGQPTRFDVVGVLLDRDPNHCQPARIDLIRNAFELDCGER